VCPLPCFDKDTSRDGRCLGLAHAAGVTGVRKSTHDDRTTGLQVVETFRFIGGLPFTWRQYFSYPLIEMRATTDMLTFSVRFGLGLVTHLLTPSRSPWILSRGEVASIRVAETGLLPDLGTGIELRLLDGRRWTFWSSKRDLVLIHLHKLGYPVTLPPWYPPASPAKDLG
jgi:hypothetical protein